MLTLTWKICERICSKHLKPSLPEIVSVLERQNEFHLTAETKALLLSMSCATINRCSGPAQFEHPHGLSIAKPSTLLKKAIPLRPYTHGRMKSTALSRLILSPIMSRQPRDST